MVVHLERLMAGMFLSGGVDRSERGKGVSGRRHSLSYFSDSTVGRCDEAGIPPELPTQAKLISG